MSSSLQTLGNYRRPTLLEYLNRYTRRWQFARYVATLSAGTAIAQGFNLALAPIITRFYTPADFAALGLFTTFLSVALVGTSLKYELGIVSASDDAEAGQLTWASLVLCLPLSILSGGVLALLIRSRWFGFGALPRHAIALLVPTLFFAGVFTTLRYWGIRRKRFGLISRATITQSAARAISQAGLGFLGTGMMGLFSGELAGRTLGIVGLLKESVRDWWPHGRKAHAVEVAHALRRNSKLPIYSLPSSMIDNLAVGASLPLVVQLFGSEAGGHFALVQRVLALPLALISASVADAFHSRMATCARDTPEQTMSLFKRTSGMLLLLGLGPALLLFFGGNRLFGFVFGSAWSPAGTLAAICAPWFLAQFIVSPLSRLVFVLRGQEVKLIYDILLLLGIVGTYEFARVYQLTIIATVVLLMLVNTVCYLLYYFVLLHIVSRPAPRWV